MSKGVLEGIIVLDFSWVAAGPLVTAYLADFGAEVIKVESTKALDMMRATPPIKDGIPGYDRAYAPAVFSSSKSSVTINLSHPKGRELARKLALKCDVVSDSYGGDVMSRWGLDYKTLSKLKPEIITYTSNLAGRSGLYANVPGLGYTAGALAGFHDLTGWPDRDPALFHPAYTDMVTPWFGVIAILAALDNRHRTGKGQQIETTHFETGVFALSHAFLDFAANGRIGQRRGNKDEQAVPNDAYPCRGEDSWCAISVSTSEEWTNLCKTIGQPQWADDHRFSTTKSRKLHEEEIDSIISEWTRNYTATEVMELMQEANVPSGIVQSFRDLTENDPQLKHRNAFYWLDHPVLEHELHYGWPIELSNATTSPKRAPLLGEHTAPILRDLLGISDDQLAELKSEGVLE